MSGAPGLTRARQVADTVLYEGYLLYPYRASSAKNQVRWQFGVLGPCGAVEAGVGEPPSMAAEVVLEAAPEATLTLWLRFLQVQARGVQECVGDDWRDTDALTVDGACWVPFSEAVPCEVRLDGLTLDRAHEREVLVPAARLLEELGEDGRVVGRLVRTREQVRARVLVTPREGSDPRLRVVALMVQNVAGWQAEQVPGWSARDVAARTSLVGTHLLAGVEGGRFVSPLGGPSWADVDVRSCRQDRCWPGLVADDAGGDALLVSPIVLGDHPAVAPESVGDLFDATEIDEILTLRVMTMTDAEKAQARGTDPRAAEILARCDGMSDDAMGRLHGGRRQAGTDPPPGPDLTGVPTFGEPGDVPWWDQGQDALAAPDSDHVLVAGARVQRGSRVVLRPARRADAQDLFLAGQEAVVAKVYFDVDGETHVAVALAADPGADLYDATGRYYYFAPDELEPLPSRVTS